MSAITGIAVAGNGQEMYAGRKPAWDGLGQTFDKPIMSADYMTMLDKANLNFEFHYSPVYDDKGNEIPKQRVVYREVQGGKDDGKRVFSRVVGIRHTQVQPKELAETAHAANPDGEYITAGYLKNSRMWLQMTGDKEFVLDPNGVADKILNYATISGTFDGSGSIVIGDIDFRLNCQNVVTSAIRNTKWEYHIRHTISVMDRLAEAAIAIRTRRAHRIAFKETATALFEAKFTTKQFENLVKTLNPERPKDNAKGRQTKWDDMFDSNMWAWNASHNAGIKGTAWGAWQALIERNQWFRKVQDTPNGQANFWAAGMGFDGPTNDYRRKALVLVGARAGVAV